MSVSHRIKKTKFSLHQLEVSSFVLTVNSIRLRGGKGSETPEGCQERTLEPGCTDESETKTHPDTGAYSENTDCKRNEDLTIP